MLFDRFRKRPLEVEAVRVPIFADDTAGWHLLSAFLGRTVGPDPPTIPTREGTMVAEPGDWIIRGTAGELYPCKPDVFATVYDPVPNGHGDAADAEIEEPWLVCEGPCNPQIVDFDDAARDYRYEGGPDRFDRMRALARSLAHTPHRRLAGDLFACAACGTVRR